MTVANLAPADVVGAPASVSTPARRHESFTPWAIYLFLHLGVGFALRGSSALATLHALATVAVGLYFLLDRHAERVVYVCGYIVGFDLLWRATGASVFWEFGKYASSGLLLLALVRYGKLLRAAKLPMLLSALMLPSLLILPYFDRREIAFNISGPVALGIAAAFFSATRFERNHLRKLLMITLGPILGLAALSARSSWVADWTVVVAGSKMTTAGIGPNQVSTMLGVGIVLALLVSFLFPDRTWIRFGFYSIALWLAVQSMLSLSRGGFWSGIGACLVAGVFLLRRRGHRSWYVAIVLLSYLLFTYALFPTLNRATGGLLEARFSDTDLTGRDKIIRSDLEAFRHNPLLGVGPGQSKHVRPLFGFSTASAHTEYSRLVAEHGSLGLAAILILAWISFRRFRLDRSQLHLAVSMALTSWALLTMFHSAMRLSAVGFLFGLGGALFTLESSRRTEAQL